MDIEKRLQEAVQSYWDARSNNKEKQVKSGKIDAGTRGEVTGGTQMGALEVLVADILCDAGLKRLEIRTRTALELPGYFRATKKWDLMVVSEGQLVLAMEFKSQENPSATMSTIVLKKPLEVPKTSGSHSGKADSASPRPRSSGTSSCSKIVTK